MILHYQNIPWPVPISEFSSVQFSCSVLSDPLWPHGLQHARLPCLSPTRDGWCHPTISFSVVPFTSCFQSFPASGSLPMSQFFASGGQSIGVLELATVLPMNIQNWFPLGWTAWISLQSKTLSRVFSNTTVQHSAFFIVQLSHPYISTGKTIALTRWTFVGKVMSLLFNMLSRLIASFNFMAAVTIYSDFGAKENKVCHCFPICLQWSDGTRCYDLSFLSIEF